MEDKVAQSKIRSLYIYLALILFLSFLGHKLTQIPSDANLDWQVQKVAKEVIEIRCEQNHCIY